MSDKTIIKYIVEGCRMFSVPIITIIPTSPNVNINITFPDVDSSFNFNINEITVIQQKENNEYPYSDLYLNNNIIHTKKHFYNNGTIIITGKCQIKEEKIMVYDS